MPEQRKYSAGQGATKAAKPAGMAGVSAVVAGYIAHKVGAGPDETLLILGIVSAGLTWLTDYARNWRKQALLKASDDSEPQR